MKNTQDTTENNSVKQSRTRKAVTIVFDVILYLFLAFAVFVLVLSLVSARNNGASNLFGYEMRIVVSDSMEKSEYSVDVSQYDSKEIKVKSMVFIERVPEDAGKANDWYASLKVGDVLTFAFVSSVTQDVITHRITSIETTDNGYRITLQGDNRAKEDAVVSQQTIYTSPADYTSDNDKYNYVIGKVVGQSLVLGGIVYGVSQPVGVALIVILPCSLIIVWQIFRVVNVVNEDRKRKAAERQKEQSEQQALELEELKRKIAELEQSKQNGGKTDGEDNDDTVQP